MKSIKVLMLVVSSASFTYPVTSANAFGLSPSDIIQSQMRGIAPNREFTVAGECFYQLGLNQAGAACVVGRLTVDELNKCFSDGIGGRGCFGDGNTLVSIARNNIDAAQRESGDLNKAVRAVTGVSIGDIEKNGIRGGDNSVVNQILKPLGF